MKASTEILLKENLKALKLSHMQGHLDALLRQAKENGVSHEDFLLSLTEISRTANTYGIEEMSSSLAKAVQARRTLQQDSEYRHAGRESRLALLMAVGLQMN